MENAATQMQTAGGLQLYFYSNASRTDSPSQMESNYIPCMLRPGDLREKEIDIL